MAIKNTNLGGTDWSGEPLSNTDLNDTFDAVGPVPVGSVISWLKSYTNVPSLDPRFVECNGQTLSDAESPFDGQVIPDLNGNNYFLRGSSTSGSTGGSEEHTHQWLDTFSSSSGTGGGTLAWTTTDSQGLSVESWNSDGTSKKRFDPDDDNINVASTHWTKNTDTKPPYYEIVWIMRVK